MTLTRLWNCGSLRGQFNFGRTERFPAEWMAGSRQENASNKEIEPPFRFNRNGKGSMAHSPNATVRTARAGTSARGAAFPTAHCRCPSCPMGGSVRAAPVSSIHRPTGRTARSPRRHRPSKLADDGNCNRPAATACAGRSRSSHAQHCAAVAAFRSRSRGKMNGTVDISWADATNMCVDLRGSLARNKHYRRCAPHFRNYRMFSLV